ncbi:MAG TPA: hypothetical protein VLF62_06525, partial [Candidatus Saccharimonadales bacterium]|nr:hypothetical protein [Candidatus Saccharimonadales bacterium]
VTQPANARKAVELVVDPSVAERTVSALGKIVDAGVPARVWYGEDDKVFPRAEYQAALEPAGLDPLLERVWAPHVAMGTPEGYEQALVVTDFLSNPSFAAFTPKY